jgi:hypothetical protein
MSAMEVRDKNGCIPSTIMTNRAIMEDGLKQSYQASNSYVKIQYLHVVSYYLICVLWWF